MRMCVLSLTLACPVLFAAAPRATSPADTISVQAAAGAFGQAPDQQLTAGGITLRYRDAGSGDPVLLIHGYTASLESMTGLANVLGSAHRVVALDVRGFGRSSKSGDAARFGQLMTDDVVTLMDHLKIARAHLVGHSMGALIGANVAARYPARVSSATLIAGPFYPDRASFAKEASRWTADLESGKGLTPFIQWLFPKMDPKMAAGTNAQMLKANDLPSLIATMRSLPDLAIAGLRAQGIPALVTAGTADPLHPLSVAFAKASPGARLLEIPGVDHVAIAAHPEVIRAMREMIQRASSSAQREAA